MSERYESKRHPIRVVARRTGLSRDVLRAWELRYEAVEPARTGGGQRLYSDADIDRLRLLQRAVDGGRRIGQVAVLNTAELQRLVEEDQRAATRAATLGAAPGASTARGFLEECLEAVSQMDAVRLDAVLTRAAAALHASEIIDLVVSPLMVEIGALWWQKRLTPGHERLATSAVRRTLDQLRHAMQRADGPPIVVATPSGQHHEIGAMLAAAAAAAEGWRVIYMGADLPAASIATMVRTANARAVALSIIYPADDPRLASELRALREGIPPDTPIIVGGGAAAGYRDTLAEIGALTLRDSADLRATLEVLRTGGGNGSAGRGD